MKIINIISRIIRKNRKTIVAPPMDKDLFLRFHPELSDVLKYRSSIDMPLRGGFITESGEEYKPFTNSSSQLKKEKGIFANVDVLSSCKKRMHH